MNAYRVGWLIVALALASVGMVAAAAAVALESLVVLVTAFAVVGAVVVLLIRPTDGPRGRLRVARDTLLGACVAGSSVAAFAGLTEIMGAAAIVLVLVLVLAVASPWAVGAVRRWMRTVRSQSAGQLDDVVRALAWSGQGFVPFQPLPQVHPATDEQLCQAWLASHRGLEAASSSRRKVMRIVDERGGYLDELERRNPAAFAAWLASGATPDGDPLPYLSVAHIDGPAINWDELIDGQDW